MIPPGLKAALAAYDETALTVLANKGLYRRARRDIEEGKVAVQAMEGEIAVIAADGDTVRIDARGPGNAACTCPAPGICRHRLAAVLLLQDTDTGTDMGESPPRASATDDILTLSIDSLRKWAGKAAWRGALELAEAGGVVTTDDHALEVSFPDDGPQVRILAGQGLDGILSRSTAATRKAWHAAAVLVARRHLGVTDEIRETAAAALPETTIEAVDPVFLDAVSAALFEATRVAFNLAPLSLEERLFTLSVSSRAEALPRLSALLRALSAQIRSRRLRDFQFDAGACLELCADIYALTTALRRPGAGEQLRGLARQEYVETGALTLTGCGADIWTTAAGARGVTAYFYQADEDRWLTLSLARGAGQDPWFDPVKAFRSEAVWGPTTLDKLAGARLRLEGAALSAEGRLSAGKATRLSDIAAVAADERTTWPCRFEDWEALRQRLRARLSVGIEATRPRWEPVLLQPHRLARPVFDELRQVLNWPIEDARGNWLSLALEHGRDRTQLMAALEKIAGSSWAGAILALATVDGRTFRLRPFALADGADIYNLGLDDVSGLARPNLVRDLKAMLGRPPSGFTGLPRRVTDQAIAETWQALVEMAEIGITHRSHHNADRMAVLTEQLTDAGLKSLGQRLTALSAAQAEARPRAYLNAAYSIRLARLRTLDVERLKPV